MTASYQDVTERLFYEMPLQPTELGVVCGCKTVSGSAARVTAGFYKEGLFQKIAITGGIPASSVIEGLSVAVYALSASIRRMSLDPLRTSFNDKGLRDINTRKLEADYIEEILLDSGVPASSIVHIDRAARNTQQNIRHCEDILMQADTATFVTYAPMQRRAIGTLRAAAEFNHLAVQTIPVYAFGINRENWDEWPIGSIVRQEYAKMDPANPKSYIGRFCVDPDIKGEISRMKLAAT